MRVIGLNSHHQLVNRIQDGIVPLREPFGFEIGNRNVGRTLLSCSDAVHEDAKHLCGKQRSLLRIQIRRWLVQDQHCQLTFMLAAFICCNSVYLSFEGRAYLYGTVGW